MYTALHFSCFKQCIDYTNSSRRFKSNTCLLPSFLYSNSYSVSILLLASWNHKGEGDLLLKILYLYHACNRDAPIEIVQTKCQTDLTHTNPNSLTSHHYSATGGFCSLLVPQWLLPSSRSAFVVYYLLSEHNVAVVRAKGEINEPF